MCKLFLSFFFLIIILNQLPWFNSLFLISIKDEDKVDIYDFGVILLELIVGRPLRGKGQVDVLKEQVIYIARNEIMIIYFKICILFPLVTSKHLNG